MRSWSCAGPLRRLLRSPGVLDRIRSATLPVFVPHTLADVESLDVVGSLLPTESETAGRAVVFRKAREICLCRLQPVVRDESTADHALHGREDDFGLLRPHLADLPRVASR